MAVTTPLPPGPDGPTASRDASLGSPAPAPRPTLGMQSISDVVFGLALSIGSVILVSKVPQSPADLGVDVLAFGFNFLIVIIVWIGYRRAVVTLPHETQATVVVNLALVFTVAVEPFLYWVLFSGAPIMLEPASVAYSLDVGSMLLLQALLNSLLLAEEEAAPRRNLAPAVLSRIRNRMWQGFSVALLFLVSALPFFWIPMPGNTTLRIDLWYVGLALFFVLPRLSDRLRRRPVGFKDGKTAGP